MGVLGLIITSLVTSVPTTIISLWWIKKNYDLVVDWVSSTKILLSSAVAASSTYLMISVLPFSSPIRLLIGVLFFVAVFFVAALLTKTICRSDVENLRRMTSGLGVIGVLLDPIIRVIEKLTKP